MIECLLCLEFNKEEKEFIGTNSSKWIEFKIKDIIEQHLMPMTAFKSPSPWLCSLCWKELYNFHKFYIRIETAQQNYKCLVIKTEPDEITSETLLEPEIVINQSEGVLFGEDHNKEHHDKNSIEAKKDISFVSKNDNPQNDPLFREAKKRGRPKTCIKKEINISEESSQESDNNSDTDENPEDTKNEHEKKHSKKRGAAASSLYNKYKSHYQRKTNRKQDDEFLAQHLKLICNLCPEESFENFPLLLRHFSSVHNERGYAICCETKFYTRNKLVDHITVHLNPEFFKCVLCSKVLTQRKTLKDHLKRHEEKQHTCDICNKKFVEKYKLEHHKLTHMPEEEKKFPCNECGKFFASESVLSHHKTVVHLQKYAKLCDICGHSMRDLDTFRRHMEKHEGKKSTYSCDICGLVVAGKRNLTLHTNSQHPEGGKKDYPCHICMKISPTLNALRKHIRCTHQMGYDYKCTLCEKAFKRSDNLKAHMATHTGADLYKCPWCPKTFNSDGNMHNHRKKIHPKEWEEARRKRYSGKLPPNYKPASSATSAVTENVCSNDSYSMELD